MYIGFIDDSGSTGLNMKDCQCPIQVVGGPIIDSKQYTDLRTHIVRIYDSAIGFRPELGDDPEKGWIGSEFHAQKMFHAKEEPWASIGQEACWQFLKDALELLVVYDTPIVHGVVFKTHLIGTAFEDAANPVSVCCNLYFQALTKWLVSGGDDTRWFGGEPALLIGDASQDDKASALRRSLNVAFRTCIKRLKSREDPLISPFFSLFDDIYFGDSRQSIGLELADISMFFIHRFLNGHPDAEGFYNIIKKLVVVESLPPQKEAERIKE